MKLPGSVCRGRYNDRPRQRFRSPSTTQVFVYADINVTDTPLFTGVRCAQPAGRAALITCGPLPARHGRREPFRDAITAIHDATERIHSVRQKAARLKATLV